MVQRLTSKLGHYSEIKDIFLPSYGLRKTSINIVIGKIIYTKIMLKDRVGQTVIHINIEKFHADDDDFNGFHNIT